MRILLIDDDVLVANSLKTILETDVSIKIIATGNSGEEAIKLYRTHKPDVLVMDIQMQGISGLEAAKEILSFDKDAKILLLTTFLDDAYIISSLQIGTKGYMLKQDYSSLIPAVQAVFVGQTVYGNQVTEKIPTLLQKKDSIPLSEYGLTSKEFEILKQIANGLNNKEISEALFLGEGTIRNYISRLLEKLDLRDRTQLAIFYYTKI